MYVFPTIVLYMSTWENKYFMLGEVKCSKGEALGM